MIGHTVAKDGQVVEIESLEEHSSKVSSMCLKFGSKFDNGLIAMVGGAYHDLGKAADIFGKRVGVIPYSGPTIHYDHMTPGALKILQLFGNTPIGQVLALAVAGHHGGMPNFSKRPSNYTSVDSLSRDTCLVDRKRECLRHISNSSDYKIYPEVTDMVNGLTKGCENLCADTFGINANNTEFYSTFWAMLGRLLLSCITDADCLCTEMYYDKNAESRRHNNHASLVKLYYALCDYCAKRCTADTDINQWRSAVMKSSVSHAARNRGVFTLEVDVGGGKTLSGLMFAIRHAINNGMDRIVYTAPIGSIIEQTADIFREIFGENNVCVHHLNMDTDKMSAESLLACDNWDAPFVVSSIEQLFDSMYSNRPTKCRKLHNLVNSVIIIDEFHDCPINKMRQVLHAIDALTHSKLYRSSVILASATLPVVELFELCNEGKLLKKNTKPLVPPNLFSPRRKRVMYRYLHKLSSWDKVAEDSKKYDRCMCIVNTRINAYELAEAMHKKGIKHVYHLSASMTPEHREKTLKKVQERLAKKLQVRLVCTSVVQTGVDISFPVIFREMAGYTAIHQSGGRCNRNGEEDIGRVFVFPTMGDKVPGLPTLQIDTMKMLLREHSYRIEAITKEEYWCRYQEEYIKYCNDTRNDETPFDRNDMWRFEQESTDICYETIAYKAKLIDEGQQEMIVPTTKTAKKLVDKLAQMGMLGDTELSSMDASTKRKVVFSRSDTRKLARFSVHAYGSDGNPKKVTFYDWLVEKKLARKIEGRRNMYILLDGYDREYGISKLQSMYKKANPRSR